MAGFQPDPEFTTARYQAIALGEGYFSARSLRYLPTMQAKNLYFLPETGRERVNDAGN